MAQLSDDTVAGFPHRCAAEPAGFLRVAQPLHRIARNRGVGGDDAVHAVAFQRGCDDGHLLLCEVGGDLHEDGHAARAPRGLFRLLGQRLPPLGDGPQQSVQGCIALQGAQVLGVGGTDVDRDVVGVWIHPLQAQQVIVRGVLDRRGGVLADVEAQEHRMRAGAGVVVRLPHVVQERVQAFVVETEAVDEGVGFRQAEHARLGVAGLGARGDGAHFDEAEPHGTQRVDAARVLVQSCGEAHAVGEGEARELDGIGDLFAAPCPLQWRTLAACQHVHGEFVGGFGIHAEEERAGEGVGDQGHGDNSGFTPILSHDHSRTPFPR